MTSKASISQSIPVLGDPLEASYPSPETLELLRLRRSTTAAVLGEPGPDKETLSRILDIAARVPDHRRVVPYRFLTFTGKAREQAGEILSSVYRNNNADADEKAIEAEAGRFQRAPVVVGVVARIDTEHKTPDWEQALCCGAVCQNMLIAASASGFAAQWLTEWYAYDRQVLDAFGLEPEEQIAGFIYIGTASEKPLERPRVTAGEITTAWNAE